MTYISEDKIVTILGLLIKCPLEEPANVKNLTFPLKLIKFAILPKLKNILK